MYGSDWMMLAIESGSELYLRDFEMLAAVLNQTFPGLGTQFFIEKRRAVSRTWCWWSDETASRRFSRNAWRKTALA